MFFYAEINKENIVVGISGLNGEVFEENLIKINDFNESLIGKKYVEGEFIEVEQPPQESTENQYLTQEQFQNKVLLDIEYLKCLAEINGGI